MMIPGYIYKNFVSCLNLFQNHAQRHIFFCISGLEYKQAIEFIKVQVSADRLELCF